MRNLEIAVIPGDGIGTEIMKVCLEVLNALQNQFATFKLHYTHIDADAS